MTSIKLRFGSRSNKYKNHCNLHCLLVKVPDFTTSKPIHVETILSSKDQACDTARPAKFYTTPLRKHAVTVVEIASRRFISLSRTAYAADRITSVAHQKGVVAANLTIKARNAVKVRR